MTEKAKLTTIPAGQVTVTTYGTIQHETVGCLLECRSFSERNNIEVQFTFVPGSLVDRARNQAVVELLKSKAQWLCFIDGDCVFPENGVAALAQYAYETNPIADIVGAYNPLRGPPFLPTVDTGTGTWESWFPGSGPVEVMRTGSAFILIKRHVYEQMEGPWYGTRHPMRPIDAFAELDNYARQKFDGQNPLAKSAEWQTLFRCAREEGSTFRPNPPDAFVGEDSHFCDRARTAGFRLFVHTDVACGHVDHKIITADDHKAEMQKLDQNRKLLVGLLR